MDDAITDESIQGLGYLKKIFAAFEKLADVGTERDSAGNRQLLYSQYASLVLLSLFNPAMQGVRGLSDASALKKVRKLIGGGRASVGSLSESVRVFDPELLEPIVQGLLADLPNGQPGPGPKRNISNSIPHKLAEKLMAVDGSALRALPQIVNAFGADANGKWRIHLQFKVLSGTHGGIILRPDETGGDDDERSVLADNIEALKVYIGDRGYERYADEIVQLRFSHGVGVVTHPVRRVVIEARSQGRPRTDRTNSDRIVLLTSLLDAPAEVIAAIYTLRWSIELFFRWLKHLLGCRKLISFKSQGIAIQIYCALIACLLLAQITGGHVGRRAFNLVCLYLQGWADAAELAEGLARIKASQKPQRNA